MGREGGAGEGGNRRRIILCMTNSTVIVKYFGHTSSCSSLPFLSWMNSNSVPPGAYSMAIISNLSSTKLSK